MLNELGRGRPPDKRDVRRGADILLLLILSLLGVALPLRYLLLLRGIAENQPHSVGVGSKRPVVSTGQSLPVVRPIAVR